MELIVKQIESLIRESERETARLKIARRALIGVAVGNGNGNGNGNGVEGRVGRKMSAKARRAIGRAQRERWARWHKEQAKAKRW
jgi:hypothetical protein